MAKTLDTFKQPFVSTVFTLSSHHPFKLPPGYKGKFKGGPLPIHKVVQYMDYSMKHFFETASKMPWFKKPFLSLRQTIVTRVICRNIIRQLDVMPFQ